MKTAADILFVTRVGELRDTGSPEVYRPLRLHVDGVAATIPELRKLAASDECATPPPAGTAPSHVPAPPVLTAIYIRDFVARRGLSLVDIPSLDAGYDTFLDALRQGVNLIAISTTWLPTVGGAALLRETVRRIRADAPTTPIMVGGVGVRKGVLARRLMEEDLLDGISAQQLAQDYLLLSPELDRDIDIIAVGEDSESALAAVATCLRDGRDYHDVPDLAFPEAGSYRFSPAASKAADIDREIVDWANHTHRLSVFDAPIRTAVGCPFHCEFCDFVGLFTPRFRSAESLVSELRTLAAALPAPRRVFFTDDNLAANRRRLVEFARALVAEKLDLSWRAFIRADAIDEETAELMRDAGCRECLLGIESGDPRVLVNMNKRLSPERALQAVTLLDRNGIGTQSTFVVGFPGENRESVHNTAALISAFPSGTSARALHRYYLFRFQVAPLSPVAQRKSRARFGLTGVGDNWAHKTMNSTEAGEAVKELFLNVAGPTHIYFEPLPREWDVAQCRSILEARETLQKQRLCTGKDLPIGPLVDQVRDADNRLH